MRYAFHRSIPEIHQALRERGVSIAERTVTHLLQRYEELVALHLSDKSRLHERLKEQGQVILALDGLQPDVGHEVLWVLRDCCSGEILGAHRMPEHHGAGSGATVGGSSELVPRSLCADQRGDHRWAALSAECSRERPGGDVNAPLLPAQHVRSAGTVAETDACTHNACHTGKTVACGEASGRTMAASRVRGGSHNKEGRPRSPPTP